MLCRPPLRGGVCASMSSSVLEKAGSVEEASGNGINSVRSACLLSRGGGCMLHACIEARDFGLSFEIDEVFVQDRVDLGKGGMGGGPLGKDPAVPMEEGEDLHMVDQEDLLVKFSKDLLTSAVRGVFPRGSSIEDIKAYIKLILKEDPVYDHPKDDHTVIIKLADASQVSKVLETKLLFKETVPPIMVGWETSSADPQVLANRKAYPGRAAQ